MIPARSYSSSGSSSTRTATSNGSAAEHLGRRFRRQSAQRVGDVGGRQSAGHVRELVGVGGQQVEQLGRGFWRGRQGAASWETPHEATPERQREV